MLSEPAASPGSGLVFGLQFSCVRDVRDALREAAASQFEFMVAPLFHPRLRRDARGTSAGRLGPATRSDRELSSKEWQSNVVGACSEWFDFDGSRLSAVALRSSEESFVQETSWAYHLGLQAIVIPTPSLRAPNYARIVKRICEAQVGFLQQLWVKVPLTLALDCRNMEHPTSASADGWEVWDSFRHLVGHHHRLSVALVVTETLPDDDADSLSRIMSRWAAEPVKAIILSTRLFIKNESGHPVLRKRFQAVVAVLLRFHMHCIFTGPSEYSDKFCKYMAYMRNFQARVRSQAVGSAEEVGESFTAAYRDTLQSPLQPLMDNLEAQTYEVFEADPVKYARYEAAI